MAPGVEPHRVPPHPPRSPGFFRVSIMQADSCTFSLVPGGRYYFPIAAVTNRHKLSSFKQPMCYFRVLKDRTPAWVSLSKLQGSAGTLVSLFFLVSRGHHFLQSMAPFSVFKASSGVSLRRSSIITALPDHLHLPTSTTKDPVVTVPPG